MRRRARVLCGGSLAGDSLAGGLACDGLTFSDSSLVPGSVADLPLPPVALPDYGAGIDASLIPTVEMSAEEAALLPSPEAFFMYDSVRKTTTQADCAMPLAACWLTSSASSEASMHGVRPSFSSIEHTALTRA